MKKPSGSISSIFVIILILFIGGCSKDDENKEDSNNNIISVNSPWQVNFSIDGADNTYVESANGDIAGAFSKGSSWVPAPDTSTLYWGSGLVNYNTNESIVSIDKGLYKYVGNYPTEEEFKDFFSPGVYSFSGEEGDGFWLSVFDSNQEMWSTTFGTGAQQGSSIIIDDITDETGILGYSVKVKISFNCTVYNMNGNSKEITNGVYVGKFNHD